jgi:hypothetical protein
VLLVCGRVLHQQIFLATLLETTQIMSSDISDNNIIMASLEVLGEIRKAFKEHKKRKNASDDEELKMLLSSLKKDQQSVVT